MSYIVLHHQINAVRKGLQPETMAFFLLKPPCRGYPMDGYTGRCKVFRAFDFARAHLHISARIRTDPHGWGLFLNQVSGQIHAMFDRFT